MDRSLAISSTRAGIGSLRRTTAICLLETAFWAPFFFLPLAASAKVHAQLGGNEFARALYATAALAVVSGYFRRYFVALRLSAFVVLGFSSFVSTGIALAHFGGSNAEYILLAIIDTNVREAAEFIKNTYDATAYLLELALLIPLIAFLIQWRKRLRWQPPNTVPAMISISLLVLHIYRVGGIGIYSPFILYGIGLPEPLPVYFALASALHTRAEISAIALNRTPIVGVTVAEPSHETRTYVVVIGESESKYHMHLYGYRRPTTPRLDAMAASHELLVFSDVVTSHADTVPALTEALTVSTGQQKERRTIIDILNAAGFKTYWLSNQSGWLSNQSIFWNLDSAVALLSRSASEHRWLRLNGGLDYKVDGALLPHLYDVLARKDEDKIVFIHLIGSHADYRFRYPREQKRFSKLQDPGCFSGEEALVVNDYDNSVHYTDLILSRIIDATRDAGGETTSAAFPVILTNGYHLTWPKCHYCYGCRHNIVSLIRRSPL